MNYLYDWRDIAAVEWFASKQKCRLLARSLDCETKETLRHRERLDRVWDGVFKMRRLVEESGITDCSVIRARDLPRGPSEHPPVELAYIYPKRGDFKLFCPELSANGFCFQLPVRLSLVARAMVALLLLKTQISSIHKSTLFVYKVSRTLVVPSVCSTVAFCFKGYPSHLTYREYTFNVYL